MTKIGLVSRKSAYVVQKNGKYDSNQNDSKHYQNSSSSDDSRFSDSVIRNYRDNTHNNGYEDSQFLKPPVQIPIRSIGLAIFLFTAGLVLLTVGLLFLTGHLKSDGTDRIWPILILGLLTFIPGSYHLRIAYYAFKGIPGFQWEDIPEFE